MQDLKFMLMMFLCLITMPATVLILQVTLPRCPEGDPKAGKSFCYRPNPPPCPCKDGDMACFDAKDVNAPAKD